MPFTASMVMAMEHNHFKVSRVASALGAEISGVDLSGTLDAAVVSELNAAWLEHQVLFFRDQKLDPDQFKAFAENFGELEDLPYLDKLEDDAEVQVLDAHNRAPGSPRTDTFHIDSSSRPTPSKGAVLYASEVPETGGDTIWVNAYAAYDTLSPPIKDLIENLTAYFPHLDGGMRAHLITAGAERMPWVQEIVKHPALARPLVHTHPETGTKALFVDPLRMWIIPELQPDESDKITALLHAHLLKPELQCRFHWRKGSVAMWDNRCTLHRAMFDVDESESRIMHRLSLKGSGWPEER
jgi:taurine dioxygenase